MNLGAGAIVSLAENNFERNPPNTISSSSSATTMGPAAGIVIPILESISAALPQPPPTTLLTVFGQPSSPLPPLTIKNSILTSRREVQETV